MNTNKKTWLISVPLLLLLIWMVACQGDSSPLDPNIDLSGGSGDSVPGFSDARTSESGDGDNAFSFTGGDDESTQAANPEWDGGVWPPPGTLIPADAPPGQYTGVRMNNPGDNGFPGNAEMDRLDKQLMLPVIGWLYFESLTPFPVTQGNEVVVNVMVRDVNDMFGCGVETAFDPDRLEVIDVSVVDSILGDDLLKIAQAMDPDILAIGVTRKRDEFGIVSGVSGSGVLVTIHYMALTDISGASELGLRFLEDTSIPRYTRIDKSVARFELESDIASIEEGSLHAGRWGQ